MSTDAEKIKVRLWQMGGLFAIAVSAAFAVGVWKNSNDNLWKTQLELNAQVKGDFSAMDGRVASLATAQTRQKETLKELREWFVAYVSKKDEPPKFPKTGLMDREDKAP